MPRAFALTSTLVASFVPAGALAQVEWRDLNPSVSQLDRPIATAARRSGDDRAYVLLSGDDAALVRTDGRTVETLRWLPPARSYRWLPSPDDKLSFMAVHEDGIRYWQVREGEVALVTNEQDTSPGLAVFPGRWPLRYREETGEVVYIDYFHEVHRLGLLAPHRETRANIRRPGSIQLFQPGGPGENLASLINESWSTTAIPDLQDLVGLGEGHFAYLEGAEGTVRLFPRGARDPEFIVDAQGARAIAPGPATGVVLARLPGGEFVLASLAGGQVVFRADPARLARGTCAPGMCVFVVDEAAGPTVFVYDHERGLRAASATLPRACEGAGLDLSRALTEPGAVWLPCGAQRWFRVGPTGLEPEVTASQFLLPLSDGFVAMGSSSRATLSVRRASGEDMQLDLRRMLDFGSYPWFLSGGAVLARRPSGAALYGGLPGALELRAELRGVAYVSDEVIFEAEADGRLLSRVRASTGERVATTGLPEGARFIAPLAGGVLAGRDQRPTHWVPAEGEVVRLEGVDMPPVSGPYASAGQRLVYRSLDRPGLWVVDLSGPSVFALEVPGEPTAIEVFGDRVVTASLTGAWVAEVRPSGAVERVSLEPAALLGADDMQAFLHIGEPPRAVVQIDGRTGDRTELPPLPARARRFLPFRGGLLFVAPTESHGFEPHFWDGTGVEPVLLADLFEDQYGSELAWVAEEGGLVYFTAERLGEGREYGATDGTPEGTRWLPALVPGPANGAAQGFGAVATLSDGRLALAGLHPEHGVEVALVGPSPPPDAGVSEAGPSDAGSSDSGSEASDGGLESGGGLVSDDGGCGCRAASPAGAGWLMLVLLVGLVRGRRGS